MLWCTCVASILPSPNTLLFPASKAVLWYPLRTGHYGSTQRFLASLDTARDRHAKLNLGYQCTGDCIQHDQQCRYEEYPCSCLWLMSTLRIMGPSKYFFTDTSLVFLMSLKIFPVMIISPQPSCRLRLEHPQMGTPLHLAFCLHSPHRPSRFAHPQEQHRRPPLLRHPVE